METEAADATSISTQGKPFKGLNGKREDNGRDLRMGLEALARFRIHPPEITVCRAWRNIETLETEAADASSSLPSIFMHEKPYERLNGKKEENNESYWQKLHDHARHERHERIMSEIIAPRARSIRDEEPNVMVWICDIWCAKEPKPRTDRERQVAHVRLMTHLLQNCDSYESDFWASIIKWQLAQYKHQCGKLLEDYKSTSKNNKFDAENSTLLANILERAVQRVYALQEPEKPTVADAFAIRNIYDDPELKTHISSSFSPDQQLKLLKVVDILLLQQPAFPPECWSLLKGT